MTEIISKQWARAVLLAWSRASEGNVWRVNRMNQIFLCRFQHSEGEGLIEVFTRHATATGLCAFQFSCAWEILGILRIRPDGPEEIEFDRDAGIGDRKQSQSRAEAVLAELGMES